MMRLPFKPEPEAALKARVPAALEVVYDQKVAYYNREVAKDMSKAPSGNRAHVFDFEDGLRLIISRDAIEKKMYVHVSASLEMENPLMTFLPRGQRGFAMFCRGAACKIGELLSLPGPLPQHVTEGKIPHWFLPCHESTKEEIENEQQEQAEQRYLDERGCW